MKPLISLHLLIIVVLFSICISCKQKDKTVYKIQIGEAATAAEETISSEGGNISIDEPGHVLNGFSLDVPDNAYDTDLPFKVSYREIIQKDLGRDMHAISPMITIDNGGEYSNYPMALTIPLNEPRGKDAMGFIYDETTGRLEGLPTIASGDSQITVMTRHFSNVFALYFKVDDEEYFKTYDSKFRPGVDDWQMGNPGNVEHASTGQCSGQSMGMLWYYRERRMKDKNAPPLNGLFEGNGSNKTPGFWQDDVGAVRFCAIIQELDNNVRQNWDRLDIMKAVADQESLSSEQTMKEFARAFRSSENPSPQYILLKSSGAAHAMVVYKMEEGSLFVADPNFPGNAITDGKKLGLNRKIVYDKALKKFKPYTSGDTVYDKFVFLGETGVISFKVIESFWPSLQSGNFDTKYFPDYIWLAANANSEPEPFENGSALRPDGVLAVLPIDKIKKDYLGFKVYNEFGRRINYKEPLAPGIQKLGMEVTSKNGNWVGFDWFEVLVPERRKVEDQPLSYSGPDCEYILTVDNYRVIMDSFDLKISLDKKLFTFVAFQRKGSTVVQTLGIQIQDWDGVNGYSDATAYYIPGENLPDNYYESKGVAVDINKWSGGILSGSFNYLATDIGETKSYSVVCTFRYPR